MPDSGDSSPHSATDDTEAAPAPTPAPSHPPSSKVRLMVSYGGRIQPRPHDHQLAYVNGETKILSLDRPLRFPDFAARLAALAGLGDLCVKYQLPGEDLDALVSVTNDEDLDHLLLEYDRLHHHFRGGHPVSAAAAAPASSRGGSTIRLRVFLFPVVPPKPSSGLLMLDPGNKTERQWFLDALNNHVVPHNCKLQEAKLEKQEALLPHQLSPPQQQQQQRVSESALPVPLQQQQQQQQQVQVPPPSTTPDYLFGLDNGFVPPPAVKVKDPAGDPPTPRDIEVPAAKTEDRSPNQHAAGAASPPVVSPAEYHRQIQEFEKLQLATDNNNNNNAHQPMQRNGSDDSLTRAHPPAANGDYYVPTKFPEKPPVPPPASSTPPPTTYLPMPGRYTSVAPGSGAEHAPVFFIPSPHGYYATTNPAAGANSYPTMYAVAPPPNSNNTNGTPYAPPPTHQMAYDNNSNYVPPAVAYDTNGRAIYYHSVLPPYPSAVNGMSAGPGAVLGTEPAKPVPVKPTVS